jgi:hypothetical protein
VAAFLVPFSSLSVSLKLRATIRQFTLNLGFLWANRSGSFKNWNVQNRLARDSLPDFLRSV